MEFVHRDPILGSALTAAQRDLLVFRTLLGRWSYQRLVAPAALGILWGFVEGNTVFSAAVAAGDNRRTHAGTPCSLGSYETPALADRVLRVL